MGNKAKKEKETFSNEEETKEFYYLSESVKDYTYSDYVRVRSFPRGMILSFGKSQPDESRFSIFHEVLLPFEVAMSLSEIIKRQVDSLIKDGLLEKKPSRKEDPHD